MTPMATTTPAPRLTNDTECRCSMRVPLVSATVCPIRIPDIRLPPDWQQRCRVLFSGLRFGVPGVREKGQVLAVSFFLQFLNRYKTQRRRIDAVALPCGGGAIVKNMTQMRVAFARTDLGPIHAR